MSLWSKPISDIEYSDVESFCKLEIPEGLQLDYKRELPGNLAKLVAAFANTRGGLILLGVEANTTTNKPSWPCDGMESRAGLSEQIMQVCRDNIYPPILPEISTPLANPSDANKIFIVVRVDESVSAPHSMRNGTEVYTRTGDTNHPIDLMNIDRISLLLDRRRQPVLKRESLIDRHLKRCEDHQPRTGNPWFWWCVVPELPSDEICQVSECKEGVFGSDAKRCVDGYVRFRQHRSIGGDWMMAAAGKHGDLFFARQLNRKKREVIEAQEQASHVDAMFLANVTWSFLLHCQEFYNRDAVLNPGMIRVASGGKEMMGFSLQANEIHQGPPFIDPEFRINRSSNLPELSDENGRFDLSFDLASELFHSFGIGEPSPRSHWKLVSP